MARVKKSPPKKSSKVSTSLKKTTKPKQIDAKLHQTFLISLAKLEAFWAKKNADLKKEIETLRAKADKALAKQKAAKGKRPSATKVPARQTTPIQETLLQAREALAQAKSTASKYASLKKLITQFERDWQKKTTEAIVKTPVNSIKSSPKAKETAKISKRGQKPKMVAKPSVQEEATQENTQKRGRKPKIKAMPSLPLVSEETLLNPALDMEESFEDNNEIFTSLDEPLDDVLAEFEMAEEADDDFLEEESFED